MTTVTYDDLKRKGHILQAEDSLTLHGIQYRVVKSISLSHYWLTTIEKSASMSNDAVFDSLNLDISEFLSKLFGSSFYTGVFPEMDSAEKLTKLVIALYEQPMFHPGDEVKIAEYEKGIEYPFGFTDYMRKLSGNQYTIKRVDTSLASANHNYILEGEGFYWSENQLILVKRASEVSEDTVKEQDVQNADTASINYDGKIVVRQKEGEDERIRKYLIEELKAAKSVGELKFVISQPTREECIAYLEKQKEQKHPDGCFTCDEYKKGYEAGRLNGFTAGYNKAMKEQKPADWSEEDKNIIEILIRELRLNAQFEFAVIKLGLDYIQTLTVLDKCRRLCPQSHCKLSEEKYDKNMDKECIKLCNILNSIPSIDTFESCCGHLKDRYSIWFFCNDIITISRLGRCVERNYSDGKWELLVDSTDTHPTGVFWLRSKVPFQSYDEMEKSVNELYNGIQYWFNAKFDSHFSSKIGEEVKQEKYWKPSEEQMKAFEGYIEEFQARAEAAIGGWNNFDVMIRLYEQLKKLM